MKIYFYCILLFIFNCTAGAEERFNKAIDAFLQGDESALVAISSQQSSNREKLRSSVLLNLLTQDNDRTEQLLIQLQQAYESDADVHYFAGVMWRLLGWQSNFFSKQRFYKLSPQAYIKAYQLQPDNLWYQTKAAMSYMQTEQGTLQQQTALVDRFADKNSPFALIAKMDLAQNQRQLELLSQLAENTAALYTNHFLAVERSAQAMMTVNDKVAAKKLFLRACALDHTHGVNAIFWRNSCEMADYLGDKQGDVQSRVTALVRLLSVHQASTLVNQRLQLSLIELLIEQGHYQRARVWSNKWEPQLDSKLQRKYQRLTQKLTKMGF